MPHVAMVIPSLAGGGAERTALRLSGGLAAGGHRVDIVLFQPHVAYPAEVPEAARLLVLCGRRVWDRRNPGATPAGAAWRAMRGLWSGCCGGGWRWQSKTPAVSRAGYPGRANRKSRYDRARECARKSRRREAVFRKRRSSGRSLPTYSITGRVLRIVLMRARNIRSRYRNTPRMTRKNRRSEKLPPSHIVESGISKLFSPRPPRSFPRPHSFRHPPWVEVVGRRHENEIDPVSACHKPLGENEHASFRAATGQAAQHQPGMRHLKIR